MPDINKKLLEKLTNLSRIELGSNEGEMLEDFKKIVDYFEDLEKLDVEGVDPVSGGSDLINSFREDDSGDKRLDPKDAIDSLPDKKDGYLKVPSVFD